MLAFSYTLHDRYMYTQMSILQKFAENRDFIIANL